MKLVALPLIALVAFAVSGCDFQPISEGRFLPVRPHWTVVPQTNNPSTLLHFDGVYYHDYGPTRTGEQQFDYFRFWPNGRVLCKGLTNFPTSADGDDFQGRWMGYYRESSSNVLVEEFIPDMAGPWRWGYVHWTFVITPQGLLETRDEMDGYADKMNLEYRFLPLAGLHREPDW